MIIYCNAALSPFLCKNLFKSCNVNVVKYLAKETKTTSSSKLRLYNSCIFGLINISNFTKLYNSHFRPLNKVFIQVKASCSPM